MLRSLFEFLGNMFGLLFEFVVIHLFDWIIWIVVIGLFFFFFWLANKIGFFNVLIVFLVITAALKVISFVFGGGKKAGVDNSYDFFEEPEKDKKRGRFDYRELRALDYIVDKGYEKRCINCKHYHTAGYCDFQPDDVDMSCTCNWFEKE